MLNETAIWPHVYQKGAPNVYRGYKYPVTYVTHQPDQMFGKNDK